MPAAATGTGFRFGDVLECLNVEPIERIAGIELLDGNLVDPLGLACLQANTGLKLPDCVVPASAQKLSAALATTDKHLAKVAAAAGVTLAL